MHLHYIPCKQRINIFISETRAHLCLNLPRPSFLQSFIRCDLVLSFFRSEKFIAYAEPGPSYKYILRCCAALVRYVSLKAHQHNVSFQYQLELIKFKTL